MGETEEGEKKLGFPEEKEMAFAFFSVGQSCAENSKLRKERKNGEEKQKMGGNSLGRRRKEEEERRRRRRRKCPLLCFALLWNSSAKILKEQIQKLFLLIRI
jgi:hypothetical protein